jgi:hypothetical protein
MQHAHVDEDDTVSLLPEDVDNLSCSLPTINSNDDYVALDHAPNNDLALSGNGDDSESTFNFQLIVNALAQNTQHTEPVPRPVPIDQIDTMGDNDDNDDNMSNHINSNNTNNDNSETSSSSMHQPVPLPSLPKRKCKFMSKKVILAIYTIFIFASFVEVGNNDETMLTIKEINSDIVQVHSTPVPFPIIEVQVQKSDDEKVDEQQFAPLKKDANLTEPPTFIELKVSEMNKEAFFPIKPSATETLTVITPKGQWSNGMEYLSELLLMYSWLRRSILTTIVDSGFFALVYYHWVAFMTFIVTIVATTYVLTTRRNLSPGELLLEFIESEAFSRNGRRPRIPALNGLNHDYNIERYYLLTCTDLRQIGCFLRIPGFPGATRKNDLINAVVVQYSAYLQSLSVSELQRVLKIRKVRGERVTNRNDLIRLVVEVSF